MSTAAKGPANSSNPLKIYTMNNFPVNGTVGPGGYAGVGNAGNAQRREVAAAEARLAAAKKGGKRRTQRNRNRKQQKQKSRRNRNRQ